MKKRLLALILAGAMAFALAACGNNTQPSETGSGDAAQPSASQPAGTAPRP